MRRLLHLSLVPALVFIVACLDRQLQTDFWVHLARGQLIVSSGHLLTSDPFSFASEPARLVDANWLSQVIFARLFSWGGLDIVQAINAGVLALTFGLLYRLCRNGDDLTRHELTPTVAAASACVLVFLGTWQTILIRPQTFSFLLFVLLYTVLCRASTRTRLIATPIIMALWCNLHGGFAIGLVLLGAFAITERTKAFFSQEAEGAADPQYSRWTFACAFALGTVATLFNPFGPRIYTYALGVAGRASARHVEEWLPPSPVQFIGIMLLLSVALALFATLRNKRRDKPLRVRHLVLMFCFIPLACRSTRMAPWWFLVAAPILAHWLGTLPSVATHGDAPRPLRSNIIAGAMCVLLLFASVMSLPSLERYNPLFGSIRSPHRTETDLQVIASRNITGSGRVYAPLEWSQYLDYQLGAGRRLLVDGHIEAFSDPVWHDYCQITSGGQACDQTLGRYRFRYLLLNRSLQPRLVACINRSINWVQRDAAGDAVLYVRGQTLADTVDASDFAFDASGGK